MWVKKVVLLQKTKDQGWKDASKENKKRPYGLLSTRKSKLENNKNKECFIVKEVMLHRHSYKLAYLVIIGSICVHVPRIQHQSKGIY